MDGKSGRDEVSARVSDIMRRMDQLISQRMMYEHEWREVADFFLPQQGRFNMGLGASMRGLDRALRDMPQSREPRGVRRRHDSTALYALDRLGSGMDGLLSPQSETWQTLALDDMLGAEADHDQKAWLDRLLSFLFKVRYNPSSGFTAANPRAIRSTCAFAVGILYLEDGFTSSGRRNETTSPIIYQHVPLSSAYLGMDAYDNTDTLFRKRTYTATQLAKRWGKEKLSKHTQDMLGDPSKMDGPVEVLHAVFPREDFDWGKPEGMVRNSGWESVWIETAPRHEIAHGGFYEFPYSVYHWQQGEESAYGDSPCMLALDDVRGLNLMRKTLLRSAQQYVDPPLAVNHEGMMNRPSLNPGSITPGGVDANGRPKILPILTGSNPMVGNQILDVERRSINSALYVDLFQMLAQAGPNETATAVLMRAEEKSNLLGPNGANISAGHVRMTTRELGILKRLGIYNEGSSLAPPESLRGRSFVAKSATPLDKLREKKKLQAVIEVTQVHMAVAQGVQLPGGDRYDIDAIMELAVETSGAPTSMLTSREAAMEQRKAAAEKQAQAEQMAAAESMARTAKDGVPAMQGLKELQDQSGMTHAPANDDADAGMLSAFAQ